MKCKLCNIHRYYLSDRGYCRKCEKYKNFYKLYKKWLTIFFLLSISILVFILILSVGKEVEGLEVIKKIKVSQEQADSLKINICSLSVVECDKNWDIKEKIRKRAIKNEVDPDKALAIIQCESSFNPKAKNPNSSAKGLAQFIDSTFENYCIGDVMNEDDNLNCFIKLYNKYPHWWECTKLI